MDDQFVPQITAELAKEINVECSVKVKGVSKSGIINENDEFTLEADGYTDEMLNGIEQAVILIEDENPNYRLATVRSVNSCTAREKRTVCFIRAWQTSLEEKKIPRVLRGISLFKRFQFLRTLNKVKEHINHLLLTYNTLFYL